MATLYDLAMQYLNQSLPKTFKYDRTPPIGTNPPGLFPQPPVKPIEKLLPRPGGNEEGFSVYNPDPNRTRNESNYSPYSYRQASERSYIGAPGDYSYSSGTEAQKMMDNYPDYYEGKQLEGIPGAIANYAKNSLAGQLLGKAASGLESLLPVNKTAILQNELLGSGFRLNDIGQIVSDGGDYDTAGNVMSGYNTSRMTEKTFDDRIASLGNMTPEGRAKRTAAILEAKQNFIDAKNKTKTVFDDKSLAKDPDYVSFDDQLDINNMINKEKEDDENFDPTDPLNLNTTTAPDFMNFYNPYERDNIVDVQRTKDAIEEARLRDLDAMDPNPGTDNKGFDPGVNPGESGFIGLDKDMDIDIRDIDGPGTYEGPGGYNPGSGNYNAGQAAEAAQKAAIRDAAKTGMTVNQAKASVGMPANLGDTGGGEGQSNAGKIVCTMMNQSYGFGSFRNKIWMKFHKDLSPEYQKGYHKLFLPLVRIAKTNKVVKKILEHIAVHSTIDMRQATRGKMHLLGRIYRKILLPLCYFVGKHGKSSN